MSLTYIDPWSSDLARVLSTKLADQRTDENAYVLIDTVFTPGLHHTLQSHGTWLALFDGNPTDVDSLHTVSPWLGQVHDLTALVNQLHRRCSGAPSLSVIVSQESCDELAARLRRACVTQSGGQRFNLRFPDTRRLPGIWQALTPAQRASLMGSASAWHFVNRSGQWSSLDGMPTQTNAPLEALTLSDQQFNQILDDCRADEMLFKLIVRNQHTQVPHSLKFEAAQQALQTSGHSDHLEAEQIFFERFEHELKQLKASRALTSTHPTESN